MDAVLLELIERMEVKLNIEAEAKREKAIYDLGVQRMKETTSKESM